MMRKGMMALAAVAIVTAAASPAAARGGYGGGHVGGGFGGHFGGAGSGHSGGFGHPTGSYGRPAAPAFLGGTSFAAGHPWHGKFFHRRFGPRAVFFGDAFPYGYYDDYEYYDENCYARVRTRWGWRWRNICY